MVPMRRERSRIKSVQMDNIRGLFGMRRIERKSKAQLRELGDVKKRVDERKDERVPH